MATSESAHAARGETSTAADLQHLTDALERVDWRDVDSISSSTAATFAGMVQEALDEC